LGRVERVLASFGAKVAQPGSLAPEPAPASEPVRVVQAGLSSAQPPQLLTSQWSRLALERTFAVHLARPTGGQPCLQ